jgi:hypothetical protein
MLHPQRIDTLLNNVHILDDTDYMMVADMKQLWENKGEAAVLAWFEGIDDKEDMPLAVNTTQAIRVDE